MTVAPPRLSDEDEEWEDHHTHHHRSNSSSSSAIWWSAPSTTTTPTPSCQKTSTTTMAAKLQELYTTQIDEYQERIILKEIWKACRTRPQPPVSPAKQPRQWRLHSPTKRTTTTTSSKHESTSPTSTALASSTALNSPPSRSTTTCHSPGRKRPRPGSLDASSSSSSALSSVSRKTVVFATPIQHVMDAPSPMDTNKEEEEENWQSLLWYNVQDLERFRQEAREVCRHLREQCSHSMAMIHSTRTTTTTSSSPTFSQAAHTAASANRSHHSCSTPQSPGNTQQEPEEDPLLLSSLTSGVRSPTPQKPLTVMRRHSLSGAKFSGGGADTDSLLSLSTTPFVSPASENPLSPLRSSSTTCQCLSKSRYHHSDDCHTIDEEDETRGLEQRACLERQRRRYITIKRIVATWQKCQTTQQRRRVSVVSLPTLPPPRSLRSESTSSSSSSLTLRPCTSPSSSSLSCGGGGAALPSVDHTTAVVAQTSRHHSRWAVQLALEEARRDYQQAYGRPLPLDGSSSSWPDQSSSSNSHFNQARPVVSRSGPAPQYRVACPPLKRTRFHALSKEQEEETAAATQPRSETADSRHGSSSTTRPSLMMTPSYSSLFCPPSRTSLMNQDSYDKPNGEEEEETLQPRFRRVSFPQQQQGPR